MATKKRTDNTSTERSERLNENIKAAGGAAFMVRLPTAEEFGQLQDLITWGYGINRNDVLRKLLAEKHASMMKRRSG